MTTDLRKVHGKALHGASRLDFTLIFLPWLSAWSGGQKVGEKPDKAWGPSAFYCSSRVHVYVYTRVHACMCVPV